MKVLGRRAMKGPSFGLAGLGLAFLLVAFRSPDGEPKPYPRSLAEVKAMVQVLSARKGPGSGSENEYLSRLRQYRYLCGVPFENLSWGDREADLALHASSICAKLNKMTHTPEKPPGMSDAEYERRRVDGGFRREEHRPRRSPPLVHQSLDAPDRLRRDGQLRRHVRP